MGLHRKTRSPRKGIRIQALSKILASVGLLLLVFLLVSLHSVVFDFNVLTKDFGLHMDSHIYVSTLQSGSDEMTEQSRLFTVTKNPTCMERYFTVVQNKVREDAHDELVRYFSDKGYNTSVTSLDAALEKSNALMDAEIHSMKLICEALKISAELIPDEVRDYTLSSSEESWTREQKLSFASTLLFGEQYCRDKEQIDAAITQAVKEMAEDLEENMNTGMNNLGLIIVRIAFLCLLLAFLFLVVFALVRILVIRPLQTYIKCIEENRRFTPVGPRELKYLALTYNKMYDMNRENKLHTTYLLEHDTLTNACSRFAFDEQKKVLSQAHIPIALLILDVDHFKEINDTYGHEAGDRALVCVVNTIRSVFRSDDLIARIGGDEFAVVLMHITEEHKRTLEEKLLKINSILQNPEKDAPKLSLSIGAAFSANGYSEELFQRADQALYQAKSRGRCGYRIAEGKSQS